MAKLSAKTSIVENPSKLPEEAIAYVSRGETSTAAIIPTKSRKPELRQYKERKDPNAQGGSWTKPDIPERMLEILLPFENRLLEDALSLSVQFSSIFKETDLISFGKEAQKWDPREIRRQTKRQSVRTAACILIQIYRLSFYHFQMLFLYKSVSPRRK